jgi:hypothetical protein
VLPPWDNAIVIELSSRDTANQGLVNFPRHFYPRSAAKIPLQIVTVKANNS